MDSAPPPGINDGTRLAAKPGSGPGARVGGYAVRGKMSLEEKLNELSNEHFARWVELNYLLGKKQELHASAAHILHVGRSPQRL